MGCSPWGRQESDTTERLPFHFSLSCIGEGNGNPLQCSCLENPRDGVAWWAAVYGIAQSRTRLKLLSSSSNLTMGLSWWLSGKESACNVGDAGSIPGSGRFPREEMATHSNILAWEISWTEEPGRLQSMGSQRVGHDLEQQKQAFTVVIIGCVLETASDTMGKDRPGGGQSVFSGP